MAENSINGLHKSFALHRNDEVPVNNYSGDDNNTSGSDLNIHTSLQESLPNKNVETLVQHNHDDGNEFGGSPNSDKHHVFDSKDDPEKIPKKKKRKSKKKKKAIKEKNANSSNDTQQQQADGELESRKDTGVAVVSFECCPNRVRIREFEPSLGELLRVGSLMNTSGTTWTKEDPTTQCCPVFPNYPLTSKTESRVLEESSPENSPERRHVLCNNSLMVVEKIKSEYDRHRVATFFRRDLKSKETDITDYMECIQKYGFSHIIIIGERDYGVLFLDCYGRVFDWDIMSGLLWPLWPPLGKSLESKTSRVAWLVEFNGAISEFEVDFNKRPSKETISEFEVDNETISEFEVGICDI